MMTITACTRRSLVGARRLAASFFVAGLVSTHPVFAEPVGRIIAVDGRHIEIIAQGSGPSIILLPSLGRGATDFDAMAQQIAAAGFRVLRPQPRGIGRSDGALAGITLDDYAADVAAVITHEGAGPAFVVGHAFGNRVARLLATRRPDLVAAVGLIAANVGKDPSPPEVRKAIRESADPSLPEATRLKALQFVFFAPGNDARTWLDGWHPEVLAAERVAGDRTPRKIDYAAGTAPVLYIQPDHDPLAHVEDAEAYKRALGERITVVVVPHASHAVIVEQPATVSEAVIRYARALWTPSRQDFK